MAHGSIGSGDRCGSGSHAPLGTLRLGLGRLLPGLTSAGVLAEVGQSDSWDPPAVTHVPWGVLAPPVVSSAPSGKGLHFLGPQLPRFPGGGSGNTDLAVWTRGLRGWEVGANRPWSRQVSSKRQLNAVTGYVSYH